MRTILFFVFLALTLNAQNSPVTVTIDAQANKHAISPLIYGVNYGDASTLPDLNAPLNRMGGNNTSRYNWMLNADSKDNDWYFESIGDTSPAAGERGDTFFSTSKVAGAQPMLTIPMVGWVANLGPNRSKLASFSISKYGPQTGNDSQWFPDAGNGILPSGQNLTGNNPSDANVPADVTFQQNWVTHLIGKWGASANGGLKYYILDNEHSIWHSTHRDVHPVGAHVGEIRDAVINYSHMIKTLDPGALIVAPEEWGWSGYLYSGFDQQTGSQNGWSYLPDHATTQGGQDYLPWLLTQWKAAGHPIDVFSVHYYPESGEFGNDVSTSMQTLRNQSTRSLWDPNYVDKSWIGASVHLIPRLKQWVNTYYYADTPVAVTEYNWGAESHINGATTQADIFGIFGREGLDMATRWTIPDPSTPTYKAMKMYRNYDGHKSTFGDTSISTVAPNPDNLSAFAALRTTDGAMTAMVVNKVLSGTTPVTLKLTNFPGGGTAQVYQLTSSNVIQRLSDQTYQGGSLALTVPAQSITLFVIAGSSGPVHQPPTAIISATPTSGTAPLTVNFSGSASTAASGSTISSYAWNFGDGTSATGVTAKHTYTAVGSYTATLTVTDSTGSIGSVTKVIPVTAPSGQGSCTAHYEDQNDWGNGFVGAITFTNTSTKTVNGWTFTWNFPGNQKITQLWNGNVSQSGKSVKVTNVSYNVTVAPGASVQVGWVATYTGSNMPPSGYKLNGNSCFAQ